jgi:hypothetical protein
MTFPELLALPQYSLPRAEKEAALLAELNGLERLHRDRCVPYGRLMSALHGQWEAAESLAALPYLPVGVFKTHRLSSVPESEIFKTLTSSGTTGQEVSRIFLDRETAQRQTMALARIMTHVLGPARLPMMIVDSAAVIKDRKSFSARGAGVLGMMNFGREHFYALDEQMRLDEPGVRQFLARFGARPFLIFGFTFMVWEYLLKAIRGLGIDLSHGVLIHSGGWKKLQQEAVGNPEFRRRFREETGLERIYNFYGMVEQVGSVSVEGEDGYLYPPNFSDVIVRDPATREELPAGQPGLIQVISILPTSYPGHSILTEDLGVVHGVDDSSCGRMGKRFSVLGRLPRAELRGCSDTHVAQVTVP